MRWKRGLFTAVLMVAVAGGTASSGVAQGSKGSDSDFKLDLHANGHATAAEVGLPVYPGAILSKDKDDDAGADLGMVLGEFNFQLKAVSYVTSGSPEQVLAFYRKPLAKYGQVLECDHGKPVGSLTVTNTGLTCSDEHGGDVHVNGSANSSNHELRAGTPHRFRIVGIDEAQKGSTKFGLVYLELPKDKDSKE